MLSRYLSAVNCSSRIAEEIFKHKVNYSYCFHFPGLEFIQLPGTLEGLSPQGRGDSEILKITYSWNILLEITTDNVVLSEVDSPMSY